MTQVIIIGGHGKVALRLARILADRGDKVTSVIRSEAQSDDVTAAGATPLVADVEKLDVAGLASVLAGQEAVVWSAGAGGGEASRTYAVDRDAAIRSMDAAQSAGVRRYIMVSYFGAGPDHGVPEDDPFYAYAESKAQADEYLKGTDLDWTILGPSRLTDDPGTGRIDVTHKGTWTKGSASRDNVAQVAAAVIAEPSTTGMFIEFNDGDLPIDEAITP
ncbi:MULTISPECIES: SDR family oxidoreductase [unclassified Gordonia (in: high G+C Gram-positive bacteria)]